MPRGFPGHATSIHTRRRLLGQFNNNKVPLEGPASNLAISTPRAGREPRLGTARTSTRSPPARWPLPLLTNCTRRRAASRRCPLPPPALQPSSSETRHHPSQPPAPAPSASPCVGRGAPHFYGQLCYKWCARRGRCLGAADVTITSNTTPRVSRAFGALLHAWGAFTLPPGPCAYPSRCKCGQCI